MSSTNNTTPSDAPIAPKGIPSSTVAAAQAVARLATSTPAASLKRPAPTPTSSGKKRPYRRTKRPKNYCDKSTVTTTTPTANTPVNVYDAVLGECNDLLKASLEAQRLGRLKMASAYQLLLHTRLIGLGKRFDRAQTLAPPPPTRKRRDGDKDGDSESDDDGDDEEGKTKRGAKAVLHYDEPSPSVASMPTKDAPAAKAATPAATAPPENPTTPNNLPKVLEQLTSVLPSNLEMDATMMEHLARAAVELHHQRTGRKKSADGLLASPMAGGLVATPETATAEQQPTTKLAWTPQEQETVEQALEQKKSASAISKLLKNKTETQVKAFLKNRKAKDSIKSAFTEDDEETPSKKRGGRGRKPPTTAMNTVPNANLDAKALLKGSGGNPFS
eukprot:scaffold2533_cov137-Cylindrotheca_fusiformis.AAC.15